MPASIIVAITALSVMITLNIGLGLLALLYNPTAILQVAISMGLGALILLGMVFGQRLAWQWGRILGMLAAVLFDPWICNQPSHDAARDGTLGKPSCERHTAD